MLPSLSLSPNGRCSGADEIAVTGYTGETILLSLLNNNSHHLMDLRVSTSLVLIIACHALVHSKKSSNQSRKGPSRETLCRDRTGYSYHDDFRVTTCSMCLIYLFPTLPNFQQFVLNHTTVLLKKEYSIQRDIAVKKQRSNSEIDLNQPFKHTREILKDLPSNSSPYLLERDDIVRKEEQETQSFSLRILKPDIQDTGAIKEICSALSEAQCYRWYQCCQAAAECCSQQMALYTVTASDNNFTASRGGDGASTPASSPFCPMTWDGFSCVEETPPGRLNHLGCPSFISDHKLSSGARATRQCMASGRWWRSPISHMEWTDYSKCLPLDIDSMKISHIVAVVCYCLSFVCVLPSCIILLSLRPLRRQPRIQLHISLLFALLIAAIFGLLWERLVMYDMLVSPILDNFVHKSPEVCRFLNIASRLSRTCTFFWMFCQGFHLQWLMLRSFKPIKALKMFSVVGWGLPSVLMTVYVAVRFLHFDDDLCWITSTGSYEWIIDGPTITCIGLNVLFLAVILKALWRQMKTQPDEMGPVRRTVRALFLLIPLFGLQQFCILYRPHISDDYYVVYAVFNSVVVGSQGVLTSIIVCFSNGEVQSCLRDRFRIWLVKMKSTQVNRRQSTFTTTHASATATTTSFDAPHGRAQSISTPF